MTRELADITHLEPAWDLKAVRRDFPLLELQQDGRPLAYLDNAATTQKPRQVIDAISDYYRRDNANVHRAIYRLGARATEAYESARRTVASFIGAETDKGIIFTRGATEAINLVAYSWGRHNLKPGDEIVVTLMEHHSNLIPWQLLARDTGSTLRHIPLTPDFTLDLEAARKIIGQQTKLVALVHKSNVFGVENPVAEITNMARDAGALMLLDAAQSVPHMPVNVQQLDCDFLAFSGHKMLGPTGVGVLYGRPDLLDSMQPFQGGGEMIDRVTMESATWNDIPWKFEAGTPNIAQAVGLGAAMDYLTAVGMNNIHDYLGQLAGYTRERLQEMDFITLYGPPESSSGIVTFNVDGIHPHDLAQFLDQEAIAVRAGHHCAQPLMDCLGVAATTRASMYIYNTTAEIDRLIEALRKAHSFFN